MADSEQSGDRPFCADRPVVMSAFPATGKTYLATRHSELVDSDSSKFSWKWFGSEDRERHPDWPGNYVESIAQALEVGRSVLVSTHEEVRYALTEARISFLLAYPRADLRVEYLERMVQRGSPAPLIQKIRREWFLMMASLQAQTGCAHVVLGPGEYLRWPL